MLEARRRAIALGYGVQSPSESWFKGLVEGIGSAEARHRHRIGRRLYTVGGPEE